MPCDIKIHKNNASMHINIYKQFFIDSLKKISKQNNDTDQGLISN